MCVNRRMIDEASLIKTIARLRQVHRLLLTKSPGEAVPIRVTTRDGAHCGFDAAAQAFLERHCLFDFFRVSICTTGMSLQQLATTSTIPETAHRLGILQESAPARSVAPLARVLAEWSSLFRLPTFSTHSRRVDDVGCAGQLVSSVARDSLKGSWSTRSCLQRLLPLGLCYSPLHSGRRLLQRFPPESRHACFNLSFGGEELICHSLRSVF